MLKPNLTCRSGAKTCDPKDSPMWSACGWNEPKSVGLLAFRDKNRDIIDRFLNFKIFFGFHRKFRV